MDNRLNYDELPDAITGELGRLIAADNRDASNKFYPKLQVKQGIYALYTKRVLDVVLSGGALIVFLPINLVIGLVTLADVGRPLFFKQKRMGKGCKPFTLVKFRNMTNETDENGVLLRADKRVTKWGKFVRKTSLDELLNFLSVFKGDMSIIGPRPLPLVYKGRFNAYHELRHSVRPGLDCPLRDPSQPMTWQNRLDNDAWYAQNVSFVTDVQLVGLLFKETLFGRDKKARGSGFSEGTFMGYFSDGRVMDSNHIPDKYYEIALSASSGKQSVGK